MYAKLAMNHRGATMLDTRNVSQDESLELELRKGPPGDSIIPSCEVNVDISEEDEVGEEEEEEP